MLVVADNPEFIKIVVAGTSLDVKRADKLTRLPGESENDVWEWLWQNTKYLLSELKEKIGISFSELSLENKMKPLIGNRILYPDGTVNSFVQRYLREQVADFKPPDIQTFIDYNKAVLERSKSCFLSLSSIRITPYYIKRFGGTKRNILDKKRGRGFKS